MLKYSRSTGLLACLLAGCGGGPTGPSPGVACTAPLDVVLGLGGGRLVDPATEGNCLRLPGGPDPREYLVVPYAGTGSESANGVSGPFQMRSERTTGSAGALRTGMVVVPALRPGGTGAAAFHHSLRRAEAALAASPVAAMSRNALAAPAALRAPPTLGEQDDFNVCATLSCGSVTPITATVRYVGPRGVIYVDDEMPAGAQPLTQADLDQLGTLFDDHLYPIDTVAFGTASDIDGDGHVAIVITDQVNDLSPDCTDGRVVGYFFGGDLLLTYPGSNRREVFFAFAPKPATATCPAVSRTGALRSLPPVLIHELQHMISFNQHVLRRGRPDESTWLNEALSHFAEELGGRLIPDASCPNSASCFAQFSTGNLQNGYLYLEGPEAAYLVAPSEDGPTLAERGSGWLFVRWLADHFASDTLRGTQLTRALLQGTSVGAANVATATGTPFASLVGEWHLANWLENLPGVQQAGRLRYRTWNLRATYAANSPGLFARPYPLVPDSTDGNYLHDGTLRAGSGRYLRVVVPAGVDGVEVRVAGQSGSVALEARLAARVAVARIR